MSREIVPVDPADVFFILPEDSPTSLFARSLTFQEQYVWEPFDSERLPATLASGIQRFLRIANLLESQEPRVAYLCRFCTFEEAHRIDSSATGRGVRQFKSSLLRKLEKDNEITWRKRKEMTDVKELKRVYHAYNEYIIKHGAAFNLDKSQLEKLIDARSIASVLYEVLKKIDPSIQSNGDEETGELTQAEIDAIYKHKVQIHKESESNDGGPSFGVSSSLNEDKYLETQDKLNKIEKKIEEMDMKFKDVDFWTSMMQNMFPDQVPPSMIANQTETNNNDKLSF